MSAPRLTTALVASPRLAAALLAAHAAAGLALAGVLGGPAGGLAGALLAALGAASAWHRALLKGGAALRALELSGDGEGAGITARGVRVPLDRSRCGAGGGWVLLVSHGWPRRTWLLTPGMLGEREFRWLRLWVRWGKLPAAAYSDRGTGGKPGGSDELFAQAPVCGT